MSKASNLARFGVVQSGGLIEEVSSPCDGSAVTVGSGAYTFQDVTAVQDGTTSYADITGSTLAYTPPSIATRVVYEFSFLETYEPSDAYAVGHHKFFIDSDEVVNARFSTRGTYWGQHVFFRWIINIGGSADTDAGRLESWTSAKTLKMQVREYGSSNEVQIHNTNSWDGSSTEQFCQPTLTIRALK
jgi:hypothetical protein